MKRYLVILTALFLLVVGSRGGAAEPEEEIEALLSQSNLGLNLNECTEAHGLIGCLELACGELNFDHKSCRRYFENGQPKLVRACHTKIGKCPLRGPMLAGFRCYCIRVNGMSDPGRSK